MNLIEMLILGLITAAVVVVSKVLGGFLTVDPWIVAIPLIAAILSWLLLPWLRTPPRRLSEMPYLGAIASTIVSVAYLARVTHQSTGIELPVLIISYGIAALVLVFIASWWTSRRRDEAKKDQTHNGSQGE